MSVSRPAASLQAGHEALMGSFHLALNGQVAPPPTILGESFQDGVYQAFLRLPPGVVLPPAPPGDAGAPDAPRAARPAWILVLAAERTSASAVWGRGGIWEREWLAPVMASGLQLVPTTGDSEDHKTLVDDSLVDAGDGAAAARAGAIGRLASKYQARAVAVLMRDADAHRIEVALYEGGRSFTAEAPLKDAPSGDPQGAGTQDAAEKQAALDALMGLMPKPGGAAADVAAGPGTPQDAAVDDDDDADDEQAPAATPRTSAKTQAEPPPAQDATAP